MTVRTTVSAVTYEGDGKRQIFPFSSDGQPIPHESVDEVVVLRNSEPLAAGRDYTINADKDGTVVTLLAPLAVGHVLDLERQTPLVQPKQFRRSGDWDVTAVEQSFDRLTRAVQDAFWRISRIERVVRVEHRTVDVPAVPPESAPPIVIIGDGDSNGQQPAPDLDKMVAAIIDSVGDVIQGTHRVVMENHTELSARVGRLEQAFAIIADRTGQAS